MKINRSTKLILDIVMGAVIPIVILNQLTAPLGAPTAYVLSALVPVAWIFIDLLFITRRFNFITAYIGLTAIVRGALAFWFVDGALFAFKDTAPLLVAFAIFAYTLVRGRPVMYYFASQAFNADTPQREAALNRLLDAPRIRRPLVLGTLVLTLSNLLAAVANYILNLRMVVAPFGTDTFNFQVAEVNAITRVAFTVPEMILFMVAFFMVYRALFQNLPETEFGSDDFWRAVENRGAPEVSG